VLSALSWCKLPRPHLLEPDQVDSVVSVVTGHNAVVGIQRQAGIGEKWCCQPRAKRKLPPPLR
jgi:hypothetical protein